MHVRETVAWCCIRRSRDQQGQLYLIRFQICPQSALFLSNVPSDTCGVCVLMQADSRPISPLESSSCIFTCIRRACYPLRVLMPQVSAPAQNIF